MSNDFEISSINPYLLHFGNIQERHFWKKNPENFFIVTILVTSYIEHLKSCYHISKQQGVFYLYQKYFKHVTSSSAEICLGFCFRKWRSVKNPIFGFCFRDLPIWVNGEYFVAIQIEFLRACSSFSAFANYWYRFNSSLVSCLQPSRKRNSRLEFQAWTKTLLFKSKKPWI